jgi:prophage antirepressor-like protein
MTGPDIGHHRDHRGGVIFLDHHGHAVLQGGVDHLGLRDPGDGQQSQNRHDTDDESVPLHSVPSRLGEKSLSLSE